MPRATKMYKWVCEVNAAMALRHFKVEAFQKIWLLTFIVLYISVHVDKNKWLTSVEDRMASISGSSVSSVLRTENPLYNVLSVSNTSTPINKYFNYHGCPTKKSSMRFRFICDIPLLTYFNMEDFWSNEHNIHLVLVFPKCGQPFL